MRLFLITAFLLSVSAAHGLVINTNTGSVRAEYPESIDGYFNYTTARLRAAGWREYVPCADYPNSNVVTRIRSDDGTTVTEVCEYEEQPEVNPLTWYSIESVAPILADHPAPEDIPDGGMFYRITNGVDAVTLEVTLALWFVRDEDHVSEQLSAHDEFGNPIRRDVDLDTRIERTYNEYTVREALSNSVNFTQYKAFMLEGAWKEKPVPPKNRGL